MVTRLPTDGRGLVNRLQDEHHLVVLQGQRPRQGALLLPGEGVIEIVAGLQRPMQILVVRRRLGKMPAVAGDEGREQGVASARVAAPATRNSLTSRSCEVLCARSTRPLAVLKLVQVVRRCDHDREIDNLAPHTLAPETQHGQREEMQKWTI